MDLSPSSGGVRKSSGYLYRQEKSSSFDWWGFQNDLSTGSVISRARFLFCRIWDGAWDIWSHLVKCSESIYDLEHDKFRTSKYFLLSHHIHRKTQTYACRSNTIRQIRKHLALIIRKNFYHTRTLLCMVKIHYSSRQSTLAILEFDN